MPIFTVKRALSTAALTSLLALSAPAHSSHAWNNYHWPREANPLSLAIGNNVTTADWKSSFDLSILDWNSGIDGGPASPLALSEVPGSTNPKKCQSTAGTVQVCNASYGYRGWLGVAQIWLSGDHITEGVVKLNDSYFDSPTYNSSAWRNLVMCQELGHTFGLGHTDENFYNANDGTCMDYTNDPDGKAKLQANNEHPNAHDFDQLNAIYLHKDTTVVEPPVDDGGGGGGGPPGGGPPGRNKNVDGGNSNWGKSVDFNGTSVFEAVTSQNSGLEGGNDVSDWGRAISFNVDGRPDVFEKVIAPGRKLITHVFWTPERSQRHAH